MNKKSKIIITCVGIVALLAIGATVAMFVIMMNRSSEAPPQNTNSYTMDESNYQQIMDTMNEQVQEGSKK